MATTTPTAEQISRITDARNTIRDKGIELGIATSTAKLDELATAIDGIVNRGAVSATVQEGDTYTIPKGYHNGSGTVSGVAGGGNYSLQSKQATPTKNQQSVTPDAGFYGLSDVTVAPIPEAYQNVSAVTAGEGDVLAGKVIVDATGKSVTGTMPNNGAVAKTLDATSGNQEYTVPKGYHSGTGKVKIVTEQKTATPTKQSQDITPTTGKVLDKVTVNPIPAAFQDVSNVDATAADVLSGKTFVAADGTEVTGTMMKRSGIEFYYDEFEDIAGSNDHLLMKSSIPKGYYDGSSCYILDVQEVTVTPSTATQTVEPDNGADLLSKVTVGPIPSQFGDTSGDDAVAANILSGKKAHSYDSTGKKAVAVTGSMANNGAVNKTLDATSNNQSYTVPAGYHNGSGKVQIVLETKTATPSTSAQNITPTNGKVLSKVTVNAIPPKFGDTTGDTGAAGDVLAGKIVHTIENGTAKKITGSMANNGAISGSIDGLTATSFTVPAGYTSGGTVTLTSDIADALAAI